MNTQKGFSTLLGLLLVLSIVGGGVYMYTQTEIFHPKLNVNVTPDSIASSTTTPKTGKVERSADISVPVIPEVEITSSSEINTTSWKTFESSTYDYEIKYPSEYNLSWETSFASKGVSDIDTANYTTEDYNVNLQIFSRNGFVLDSCLKDLSGKDIKKTIKANGLDLYVYNDHEVGLGGRMALTEGAIRSEYHAIHQGYCYIIMYTIVPTYPTSLSSSQMSEKVKVLDGIVSTFKFTK